MSRSDTKALIGERGRHMPRTRIVVELDVQTDNAETAEIDAKRFLVDCLSTATSRSGTGISVHAISSWDEFFQEEEKRALASIEALKEFAASKPGLFSDAIRAKNSLLADDLSE